MTTTKNTTAPVLTRCAEAETCTDPSSTMTLLADSAPEEGGFTVYRSTFAAGAPEHPPTSTPGPGSCSS